MANRDVTVKLTELGSDIENISIYKSSFTDANYIASVSRAVLMGDGYTFSVDDQISKFLLYSGEPCNTTLELNLPSPTTTTTTSAGTTTTSTTTTAAPTTTTTTPQPSPTDKSYQLNIINSTTGGAVISGATTITLTGPPNSSRSHTNVISAANGYTSPNTITATSPQAEITPQLNGTTSSTSRTLTSTVVIPANGGNGQVTIYGNFTQTTTTTAAPTTTTTTAAPITTTTTTSAQHTFTLTFVDSINNASFPTTSYVFNGVTNQIVNVPARSITPSGGYTNETASYTVTKSGTNSGSVYVGNSSVSNTLSGIQITMPDGGGEATITASGSAVFKIYGANGLGSASGFYLASGAYATVCNDSANGYYWLDTNGLSLSTTKVFGANDGTLSQAVDLSDGNSKLEWDGSSVQNWSQC
jgi:hypothetical protein